MSCVQILAMRLSICRSQFWVNTHIVLTKSSANRNMMCGWLNVSCELIGESELLHNAQKSVKVLKDIIPIQNMTT